MRQSLLPPLFSGDLTDIGFSGSTRRPAEQRAGTRVRITLFIRSYSRRVVSLSKANFKEPLPAAYHHAGLLRFRWRPGFSWSALVVAAMEHPCGRSKSPLDSIG